MTRRRRPGADERGETLAEILVTISIMGILFAAVLGALGISAQTSDISRKEGTVETLLRSYAEQVQSLPYVTCAPASSYAVAGFTAPTGYAVPTVTGVRYWDGNTNAAFGSSCPVAGQGVEAIDLKAQSNDGRAVETLTIYKRAT